MAVSRSRLIQFTPLHLGLAETYVKAVPMFRHAFQLPSSGRKLLLITHNEAVSVLVYTSRKLE
jgi:hypothetical protein